MQRPCLSSSGHLPRRYAVLPCSYHDVRPWALPTHYRLCAKHSRPSLHVACHPCLRGTSCLSHPHAPSKKPAPECDAPSLLGIERLEVLRSNPHSDCTGAGHSGAVARAITRRGQRLASPGPAMVRVQREAAACDREAGFHRDSSHAGAVIPGLWASEPREGSVRV